MVNNRPFTAVVTPDLEAGGFVVQCQEIPAAISQAETETEALENIIEVLGEHFEYVAKHGSAAIAL